MGITQSTQHPYIHDTKTKGRLQGLEYRDHSGTPILHRYTKIPYAQPPVGNLRWRRPRPLPANFTFNVSSDDGESKPGEHTKFGPLCPQPEYATDDVLTSNPDTAPDDPGTYQDEDCLYLNIWVPSGTPPEKSGWPVQFYIHGGWLQVGDANQTGKVDPFDLLRSSTRRIIVAPAYRLNLFGFAGGEELSSSPPSPSPSEEEEKEPFTGNFGFWDQRLALEWTYENIGLFGGDKGMISVGGLSAGAHSSFMQLYYDSYLPEEKRVVRQVYMHSNALAVQPNGTRSEMLTEQFGSIAVALGMDEGEGEGLSAREKVARLRAVPWRELRDVVPKLKYHTFRASTDGPIEEGGFVPPTFLASLHDGSFATRLAERGTRLLFGEVRDEGLLYKVINPPGSYGDLITQLCNYYPRPVVDALVKCEVYDVPGEKDEGCEVERWHDVFADITADGQVHASIRGLAKVLLEPPQREGVRPVPADRVFRYKICWRAEGLDKWLKPSAGMCHGSDIPIWWCSGYRADYSEEDKKKNEAFIGMFGKFLQGEKDIGWGGSGKAEEVLLFDEHGKIHKGFKDDDWQRAMTVWDTMWGAQKDGVQHRH